MNELKFQGVIKHIEAVRAGTTGAGEEYRSIKFQVEEQKDQYPQCGVFSMFKKGDYMKMIDDFARLYPLGTEVIVTFNLKTSEWQGNFYGDNSAWKIEKVGGSENDSQEKDETIEPSDIPF